MTQDDIDATRAPLMEHLIELRKRLLYCLAAFLVAFLCAYGFAQDIFLFLVKPLATLLEGEEGRRLIYTGLTEAFLTYLSVAFFAALFITLPILFFKTCALILRAFYITRIATLSPMRNHPNEPSSPVSH